ncbi:uncharacterized protein LOC123871185 isoform X2 [Maniola jurtina]|uniref:uncharacterized protein LOC123871185 isoform X1 n=1 Tax=Maniola jurtina TaxID=191418 RepID=UPI001E687CD6|nr:uncharacterized protein LOC123871185 isoform X1 [Maniola jurtina]XP_045770780.1 uncharacterized protein LOC123871185 isoform X2 [Maniola jurtina]
MSAYGACIYLKSIDALGKPSVHLLCSKSRVAPAGKPMTIPRLELSAAQLAARRHVPTDLNPADMISRGIDAIHLKNSKLWWNGPEFLLREENQWPTNINLKAVDETLPELKTHSATITIEPELVKFENYSNLSRLKRSFAYARRFINNCKNPASRRAGNLTLSELNESFMQLVVFSQKHSFQNEYNCLSKNLPINTKSKLSSLSPFLDKNKVMRVGGRLDSSEYEYEKRHPIILDGKHTLTKLLFRYEHTRLLHAGPQTLLYSIREAMWPMGGRVLARRTVRDCVTCRRHQGHTMTPLMGNLPAQRVMPAFPFQTVGIDFAGPFSILNRKGRGAKTSKAYLCLFICFRYKCVHLEAVSDLSKDALILALRRMISRRGKPLEIFSDNGRNLVSAAKEITQFLKSNPVISDFAADEQIKFSFIPAYAKHFAGIWEAGIKSAKHHIKRYLGHNNLTFEELSTLFSQVEAILNSRPLYPMSSSPDDLLPLSPGHFLIGRPLTALPSPNFEDFSSNSLDRYSRLERVRQQFWRRWQRDYISELQQRIKWRTNRGRLNVGDLVLLQEDNIAPLNWRLGRVTALYPGTDGISRVADVRTARGVVRRALTSICPLFSPDELFSS